ncbi:sulfatase [Gemmatimonadota bacterium]
MHLISVCFFLGSIIALLDSLRIHFFIQNVFGLPNIISVKITLAVLFLLVFAIFIKIIIKSFVRKNIVEKGKILNLWCIIGAQYQLIFMQFLKKVFPATEYLPQLYLISAAGLILGVYVVLYLTRLGSSIRVPFINRQINYLYVIAVLFVVGEACYNLPKIFVSVSKSSHGMNSIDGKLFVKLATIVLLSLLLFRILLWLYKAAIQNKYMIRIVKTANTIVFISLIGCGILSTGYVSYSLSAREIKPKISLMNHDVSRLKDKYNVIIILCDALRADLLGYMNEDLPDITPNIDSYSSGSTIFTNAYATGSWTVPSVASLFTSTFPMQHGLNTKMGGLISRYLDNKNETLAEVFSREGYFTSAIVANPIIDELLNFEQGFDDFTNLNFQLGQLSHIGKYDRFSVLFFRYFNFKYFSPYNKGFPYASELTDEALKKLKQLKDKRFLMYLHYMDPHGPYHLRKGFFPADGKPLAMKRYNELVGSGWMTRKGAESEDLQKYFTEVGFLDKELGNLIRGISELDLADNTIVVFLADHGEEFFDHGGKGHGHTLYEEVVHIPMFIRYPNNKASGVTSFIPVSIIDVLPTILQLNNYPITDKLEGKSLLREDILDNVDRNIFFELDENTAGMFSGGKKFIKDLEKDHIEVYSLDQDPYERNDLGRQLLSLADTLDIKLNNFRNYVSSKKYFHYGRTSTLRQDPELRERLKALGYVE